MLASLYRTSISPRHNQVSLWIQNCDASPFLTYTHWILDGEIFDEMRTIVVNLLLQIDHSTLLPTIAVFTEIT